METPEGLNELITKRLIDKNGDVKLSDNNDIVLYGNTLGITENQLLFKILDISETINWSKIEKKKEQEKMSFQTSTNDNPFTSIIPHANQTIRCSICNAINEKGIAKFCVECGCKLKEVIEPLYEPKPTYSQANYAPQEEETTTKSKAIIGAITGVIIFLIAGYFFWGKNYLKDKNADRMYSFANSLALRSSPAGGGDYNMIANIPYGSEVLVYDKGTEWVNCKVNGQEGYASPKYMINKADFQELNAILADEDSRTAVSQTRYKKAILAYFREHKMIGKMDETIQKELYGTVSTNEVWQLFANADVKHPNTVYFSRKSKQNSKFNDFACIIKNLNSGERKILLFSFDDSETPKFEGESQAPTDGYISSINYDYNTYDGSTTLTPMYTSSY